MRMGGQAGIEDPAYLGLRLQEPGDLQCALVLLANAQVQGFQSLHDQPGIERADRRTDAWIQALADLLDGLGIGDDRAANRIAVPAQVFR